MQSKTVIVLLAAVFIMGTIVSQASFAFADNEANPLSALWNAIDGLNSKTNSLQAQIDELKAQKGDTVASSQHNEESADVRVSVVAQEAKSSDGISIDYVVSNAGQNDAVGVKLTAFYKMSLLHIQFISSAACADMSRGIIECHLGTIKAGETSTVTVIATSANGPISIPISLTADVTSIGKDSDYTNNHQVTTYTIESTTTSAPIQQESKVPEQASIQQNPQNITQPENQTTTSMPTANNNATSAQEQVEQPATNQTSTSTQSEDNSSTASSSTQQEPVEQPQQQQDENVTAQASSDGQDSSSQESSAQESQP